MTCNCMFWSVLLSDDKQHAFQADTPPPTKGRFARRAFWIWIVYQSVKGMITLSLIWIPLLWFWLRG